MAFQSFEELIRMARENPKQAQDLVNKARRKRIPVVDESNSGYRMEAMKRKIKKSPIEDIVAERKEIGY